MSTQPHATRNLYWLVVGDAPNGPFGITQIHAKLMAGEITWHTLACPVGGSAWLPLVSIPGLGPTIVPPTAVIQAGTSTSTAGLREAHHAKLPAATSYTVAVTNPPPAPPLVEPIANPLHLQSPPPALPNPQSLPKWPQVLFAVVGVLIVVWLLYSWLRPLRPREVCDKFAKAKTLNDLSQYTTLNLLPALTALSKQQTPESDDPYELTQEAEAPREIGGYLVGFRGHFYVPEEKRRMQIDGVFHLIDSSGWKIEDVYYCAVDRRQLEQPLSLANDYRLLVQNSGEVVTSPKKDQPATTSVKSWNEQKGAAAAAHGIMAFLNSKAAKTIGVVLAGICLAFSRFGAGVLAFFTAGSQKKKDTA